MTHRLERILKLMSLLQSGIPFNALQLAQETNVHRRTVFRDVALLRAAGIPIRFDTDTACYSVVGDVQFQAEGIRPAELSGCLEMACLGNFLLRGNVEVIGRTVQKLAAALPQKDREAVEQLLQHCRISTQPEASPAAEENSVLAIVARGIRQQHQLLLLVNDGARDNRPMRMSNAKLVFAARGFTLVGQSLPEGRTVELTLSAIREASTFEATDNRRPDVMSPTKLTTPRDPPATV